MRIGILGTGTLARALGSVWARAGHDLVIGGRSPLKASALAAELGVAAGTPREAVRSRDAVLLAVPWEGVADSLRAAGAHDGTLSGTTLIDPVNAVEHGIGELLPISSAAEEIALLAPGAHVVKAFHMFEANRWTTPGVAPVTVAMCGDDDGALARAGDLARDAGAVPAVVGPLRRARQLEEVAGFVIALVFAGHDPQNAVPRVRAGSGSDSR